MFMPGIDYNEIRGDEIKEMLVYLTSRCQLRCTHCYVPKENTVKELSLEDIESLTKKFKIKKINFLGGEPFLHPNLVEAVQMFEKVTISTNGIILSTKNSKSEEFVSAFRNNKNVSIQLSIQGNKNDTDQVRGDGVWNKVMAAAKLLKTNNIPCFFLCNYSYKNLGHIPDLIDNVTNPLRLPIALFPEIGEPPLTVDEQTRLFTMIVKKNEQYKSNNLVDQPNFFQWLGLPGRCGAGSERLCLTYDKEFTPCHFDFNYCLGNLETPLSIINRNRETFVKTEKRAHPDCLFCKKSEICRSGCYMSGSFSGCPFINNYTIERYAFSNKISVESLSNQISNIKGLLRDSLICP